MVGCYPFPPQLYHLTRQQILRARCFLCKHRRGDGTSDVRNSKREEEGGDGVGLQFLFSSDNISVAMTHGCGQWNMRVCGCVSIGSSWSSGKGEVVKSANVRSEEAQRPKPVINLIIWLFQHLLFLEQNRRWVWKYTTLWGEVWYIVENPWLVASLCLSGHSYLLSSSDTKNLQLVSYCKSDWFRKCCQGRIWISEIRPQKKSATHQRSELLDNKCILFFYF